MTNDMRNQHGAVSWGELMTPDPQAAVGFYEKVLGWTSKSMEMPNGMGEYICFSNAEGKEVAGAMAPPPNVPKGAPPVWGLYVTVDDVDATIDAAVANGGKVICPPTDCDEMRMAHFADPQGAVIAVIKYNKPFK